MEERTSLGPCAWYSFTVRANQRLEKYLGYALKVKIYNDSATTDLDVELFFEGSVWKSFPRLVIPYGESQSFDITHMQSLIADIAILRKFCVRKAVFRASSDVPCRLTVQRVP